MEPGGTGQLERRGAAKVPAMPARGDRLVNFALPDTQGVSRIFYFELTGGPAVVMVYRSIIQPGAEAALRGLVSQTGALRDKGVEIFVVSGDDVATNRTTAQRLNIEVPLFSDLESTLLPILLAPRPPRFPETRPASVTLATYLLDPNQRVLGVVAEGVPEQHAVRAGEMLAAEPAPQVAEHTLVQVAPVLTLSNVFDPAFCTELIDAWRQDNQEGGVSDGARNLRDESKKRNREHVVLDQDLGRRIKQTLAQRIGPELSKVFHFNQPYRFEGFTVLSYRDDRQDFFGIHRDSVRQVRFRRFAVSLNLNDDFEGGELSFPEFGPHLYRPEAGAAVVFSCNLLHEALPVTRGQRWVLTTFFCDPDPKAS
ncbi:MAG: 2OG-Fe(II) oxygenase [Pseudomonadota bacterium]